MIDRCSQLSLNPAIAQRVVVLTRPEGQAQALAQALAVRGLDTVEFPLIKLQPLIPDTVSQSALDTLERYALVVFVSPNAIEYAFKHILRPWPVTVPIGVLGPGSTRALARQHMVAPACQVIAPSSAAAEAETPHQMLRYDSEALASALDQRLGLPSLKGQRVLIVRGNGGRPWLINCLRSYGATVETVTVYQRLLPNPTPGQWARVRELVEQQQAWVIWLITSSESVRNLQTLAQRHLEVSQQKLLKRTRLVVTHERIAESARALGFDTITQTAAGDESIIRTLLSLPELVPQLPKKL